MSRKIPVHELADLLAKTLSISNEAAESFIRNFFDLVAEGVTSGEIVKVKGIGTFSACSNSENPVEFVPDKTLADTINAPFALFEPEPLSPSVTPEALAEIDRLEEEAMTIASTETSTEPTPDQIDSTEEQMAILPDTEDETIAEVETKDEVLQETETSNEVFEESIAPAEPEPEPASEPVSESEPETEAGTEAEDESETEPCHDIVEEVIEEAQDEVTPLEPTTPTPTVTTQEEVPHISVAEETPQPDPVEEKVSEPKPELEEKQKPTPPAAPVSSIQHQEPSKPQVLTPPVFIEEEPEEHVQDGTKQSGGLGFGWGLAIGLIVGLALGACGVYLTINYLFPMPTMPLQQEQVAEEVAPVVPVDTIVADTIASQLPADTMATPVDTVKAIEQPAPAPAPAPTTPEPKVETKKPAIVKDKIRPGYLLHEMAKKHYGNKAFWVYIYEANSAKIGNPNKLKSGLELVIPPAEKYGINPSDPASVKAANDKAGKILAKYHR